MLSSREAIKVKRNGRMYEMQPIYMNATKCKMQNAFTYMVKSKQILQEEI